MARRGRFGRVPRAAPSLTATIIALAREMAAAIDRSIQSAWQNGGTYQGKPVTDEMYLAHLRSRTEGLDKDDPAYDLANQEYQQADYSINESKQSTLYAQGRISDRQMGQFYLNWAKKIPKDSEFYRRLQRDGARFMQAAAARDRAGAAAAKNDAYNAAQARTAKGSAAGNIVKDVLTKLAVVNGLLDYNDPKGLANLSDPAQLTALVGQMNARPDDPIYLLDGVPVTGNDIFAALKAADPSFQGSITIPAVPGGPDDRRPAVINGGMTTDYILKSLGDAHETNLVLADRATAQGGKKSEAKAYLKAAGAISETVRDVRIWGVAPAYNMIIKTRNQVLNDKTATNVEKKQALDGAASGLAGLADSPGLDTRTIITLSNEANANAGFVTGGSVSTFGQDYLGVKTPGAEETTAARGGDADELGGDIAIGGNAHISSLAAQLAGEIAAVSDGTGRYVNTFGNRNPKTGIFEYDPNGTEIGAVPTTDITRSGAIAPATVAIEQADGSFLTVVAVGRDIKSVAYDANGNKIDAVNPAGETIDSPSLGIVYTYGSGGDKRFLYQGPDGGPLTKIAPWANGAVEIDNPDGSITVDVTRLVGDGQKGSFRRVQTDTEFEAGTPGTLVYDPSATAVSSDREVAGFNSAIDFNTAIMASLSFASDPKVAARSAMTDPMLSNTLIRQQAVAVGVQLDENNAPVAGDIQKFLQQQYRDREALSVSAGLIPKPLTGALSDEERSRLPNAFGVVPSQGFAGATAGPIPQYAPLSGTRDRGLRRFTSERQGQGPQIISLPTEIKTPIIRDDYWMRQITPAPLPLPVPTVLPVPLPTSTATPRPITGPATLPQALPVPIPPQPLVVPRHVPGRGPLAL